MAQLLFDALTGNVSTIDSQAVFAVQSLLEPAHITSDTGITTTTVTDDDDVFQCGKCKKQFTSLSFFIDHKKEHCLNILSAGNAVTAQSSQTSTNTQNAQLAAATLSQQITQQAQTQVPTPQLTTLPPNMVLSEADLLSLTNIEQSIATITSCPSVQTVTTVTNNPQLQHINLISQSSTSQSVEQLHQSQSSPQIQAHAVGLSLLTNTFVSTPLFVGSQTSPNQNNVSSMVVSLGNPSQTKDAILSPISIISNNKHENSDQLLTDSTHSQNDETSTKNVTQEMENTINVVSDFQSNQSKPRKRVTNSSELSETGTKKISELKCNYCDKLFGKNFDLQQHVRCHTGEKPFQCIVCGRAFAQKSNVKKHMQTHKVWPDGLAHTLPKLSYSDEEEIILDRTDKEHYQTKKKNNDAESENTTKSPSLKNGYVCPYCKFTGKSYFVLKSHMKQHKQEKVYKCILSTCGEMFHDLDPFLEHTKSHENEMTYRCHQCNKTFQTLYELGAHQYSHSLFPNRGTRTQPRFFRCSQCLNKYATPAALDHHMATSSHSYACPFVSCNKIFPCERYLRRHLHTHGSADIHICKDCGKGFKTEHYLKVHALTHSGAKPFMCEQCGSSFNRRDKLKRHYLVHEPIKRFKCPFRSLAGCPKEFNRPDKLKAHILTHSCIKPFMCKLCGRNFTRKSHLRDHEHIHTDNNCSFYCKQCGKGFEQESVLQNHQCTEIVTLRKRRLDHKFYRPGRPRKLKSANNIDRNSNSQITRKPGRPKKVNLTEQRQETKSGSMPESDLSDVIDDDIPTAHIEIISTNENLRSGEITEISLPVTVTNGQFQSILTQKSEHLNVINNSSSEITNKFHIDNDGNITIPNNLSQVSLISQNPTDVMEINDPHIAQIVVLPASETAVS